MKYSVVLLIIFVIASMCNAQVAVPETESKEMGTSVYGIGLSAGIASGLGLSFRHHLPSKFSYQLIGGVIKVDKKVSYNLGSELQYDFTRGNDVSGPLRIGLGIGGEFRMAESLNIGAEFLFTYYSNGDILPLPQFNLHYYFF